MKVAKLDHIVLTANDLDKTIAFYTRVLGMELEFFGGGRRALRFGSQKINLHKAGVAIKPHALNPLPGSVDLCFITEIPLQQVISHLNSCDVPVINGPVKKTGATGPLLSVYIHDPNGNLIEIANQVAE